MGASNFFIQLFVAPEYIMDNNMNDKFLPCRILRSGDVARFIRIDEVEVAGKNKKVYQGIIVEVARPGSDGEITYKVFCDDNIIRFFGDYEAIEEISLVDPCGIDIKLL